jgi:hypothetical protein
MNPRKVAAHAEANVQPQAKTPLTESLESLVKLCEATDEKEEADKWR